MNVKALKKEAQIAMLKDICKQLSEAGDDYLNGTAEELLDAIVDVLENQSCDDMWTTEGWQHYFGYGD